MNIELLSTRYQTDKRIIPESLKSIGQSRNRRTDEPTLIKTFKMILTWSIDKS